MDVKYPGVTETYSAHISGIDKTGMLTHLYKNPSKSKVRRWYLWLFGCVTDGVVNAWLVYKRDWCSWSGPHDCLEISNSTKSVNTALFSTKRMTFPPLARASPRSYMVMPVKVWECSVQAPDDSFKLNSNHLHVPFCIKKRQTCRLCSSKVLHRSLP